MSPTAAMLMRSDDLPGGGGEFFGAGVAGVVGGAGGVPVGSAGRGALAQPASCNTSSAAISLALVTETNAHDVNFGGPQPAARHVEFVELVDRTDVNPEVVAVVDSGALYA